MYLSLVRPLTRGKGTISQRFGERDVDYSPLAGHPGLDYSVAVGAAVYAPIWGRAKVIDDGASGYGLHIEIRNDVCLVLLAHLSYAVVRNGELVEAGQQIALSGDSGRSTGPHLHLGLKLIDRTTGEFGRNPVYNGWVDPEPFRDA
jgi:murein DD-endopeptidase MepM/ murein hydrolase activator NlpD